jgi:tetratricopeptide (TPR) repeat protein
LHELHRAAGKPGVRGISAAIRDREDLRDTVSHETISAMLRGSGLPRWIKVECVVRQLAEWTVSRRDPDREVRRFHGLWLAASDSPEEARAVPPKEVSRDFVTSATSPDRTAVVANHRQPVAGSQGTPPAVMIGNLPGRTATFTGRQSLFQEVRETLVTSPRRPLALHGLGGVGKTQLTIEYAHRWAAHYDLVWWVPAERPSQAVAALAALGERLDLPDALDMRQTARGVLDALETSSLRWLVVYDNADLPEDVAPLMPAAGGHVIVTSRNSAWASMGNAIEVGVFTREESIEFLRGRGSAGSAEDMNRLAEQLGDLPLALAQVGAMQAATGMPVAEYLRLFAEHLDELLAAGRSTGSPTNVTTFVNVAFGRLQAEAPAAGQLLEMLAFMGPEPVSLVVLRSGRDGDVSPPLGRSLYQPEAVDRIATQIARYGLGRLEPDGQRILVHRLVQVVLRERLDGDAARRTRADVHRLLAAANPGDPDDPRTWYMHAEIGPHLVAARAIRSTEIAARRAVLDQIRYLERIGDFEASVHLGRAALDAWQPPPEEGGLGPDHELTILATRHLANALRGLGHYEDSRRMIVEALERLRHSPHYGEDHLLTLDMATLAAAFLRTAGSYRQALALDQDRVDRLRRLYGDEHVRTLTAMKHLAINLRLTGDSQQAYDLDAKVVESQRAQWGEEHPRTLDSIRNLARDLYDLGRYRAALDLQMPALRVLRERFAKQQQDIVRATRATAIAFRRLGNHDEAMRRATENYQESQSRFGPDHEETLAAMMTYANTLRTVGDAVGARSLATEALTRYRRIFGEQNPLTLAAATNLAIILRDLGRRREAHRMDEVTLDETRRVLGPEHPHTLAIAAGLGTDLAYNHEYDAARSLDERTFDASRRTRGDSHPETWMCNVNLAWDLRATGDESAGHDLLRRSLDTLGEMLGGDHPDVQRAGRGERLECDVEPPPT